MKGWFMGGNEMRMKWTTTLPSLLPLRESGTCYHRRSRHCCHCRLSSVHWRRNCFADRTTTHTSGNSSIDTSLIGPTWHLLRPWSFVWDLCRREIRGWWWWWWWTRNLLTYLLAYLQYCYTSTTIHTSHSWESQVNITRHNTTWLLRDDGDGQLA